MSSLDLPPLLLAKSNGSACALHSYSNVPSTLHDTLPRFNRDHAIAHHFPLMMSVKGAQPGSSPPASAFPYSPGEAGHERSRLQSRPAPSLPPMSSILPKHDGSPHQQQPAYPPRYHLQSGETLHPLHLSQEDPSAPPQHIYVPPQPLEHAQTQRNRASPLLVPIQPTERRASPEGQGASLVQRRMNRKIGQRKEDSSKEGLKVDEQSVPSYTKYSEDLRMRRQGSQGETSREKWPSIPRTGELHHTDQPQSPPIEDRRTAKGDTDISTAASVKAAPTSQSVPISGLLSSSPMYDAYPPQYELD